MKIKGLILLDDELAPDAAIKIPGTVPVTMDRVTCRQGESEAYGSRS